MSFERWLGIVMMFAMLSVTVPTLCSAAKEPTVAGTASAHISKVHGDVGESFMDRYFKSNNWEKIHGEVGNNGIDGLFIQRHPNGSVKKVLIVESKFGGSKLGEGCNSPQMSEAWVACKLDNLEKSNTKKIEQLKTKKSKGMLSKAEAQELKQAEKNLKDYQTIRRHVDAGNYRRRLFRTTVKNGELRLHFNDIAEKNGVMEEAVPDRRAKIESRSMDKKRVKQGRTISLKEPPTKLSDRKVYNDYFQDIEDKLRGKGVPKEGAEKLVGELKQAYAKGDVTSHAGKKGQHAFLKKRYMPYLEDAIKSESNPIRKAALLKERRLFQLSERMNRMLEQDWFLKPLKKIKNLHASAFGGKLLKVNALLARSGEILAIIDKSTSTGIGAGLISFAFDAGGATYSYVRGETFRPEFQREISDAAAKGGVVGTSTAITVILGATPLGWAVAGVGIAGYMITDIALKTWHHAQDKKYLSPDDLAIFGIEQKVTIPLNAANWRHDRSLDVENWR